MIFGFRGWRAFTRTCAHTNQRSVFLSTSAPSNDTEAILHRRLQKSLKHRAHTQPKPLAQQHIQTTQHQPQSVQRRQPRGRKHATHASPPTRDGEYLATLRREGRYITTPGDLASLCESAHATGRMAIDTEFHLEKTYFLQLALVQVAVGGQSYCIDPIALRGQLGPLDDLICDASVQKQLHAASMDLRAFYERTRRPARNVLDTQLAAGLLGHGVSAYSELVQMYCGVQLPKGSTMSDWLQRPLQDEQLRYALDDVVYLERVADGLVEELRSRDRLGVFEEECIQFETDRFYQSIMRRPQDLFPRVKKVKALDPEQQVKALRLVEWREREAAAQNKPPYFLLKDQSLTEIARLSPSNPAELLQQGSRVVHPNLAKYNGHDIVQILQTPVTAEDLGRCEGLLGGSTHKPTKMELARANAVFSLAHAFFLNICAAEDMEPQFVTSHAHLKLLVIEVVTGQLPAADFGHSGLNVAERGSIAASESSCGLDAAAATVPAPHHEILVGWRWHVAGKHVMQFLQGSVSVSYDPNSRLPVFSRMGGGQ